MNAAEEAELIRSVEQGEWTPVTNLDVIKAKLSAAASETAENNTMPRLMKVDANLFAQSNTPCE